MWEFFQGRKKETLVTVVDMLSYNNFYSTSRNNSYDNDNDNDDVDGFFNVLACFLLSASKKKCFLQENNDEFLVYKITEK